MPDEMEKARAVRGLLVDARQYPSADQKEVEVAAFVSIFHPDHVLPSDERYTEVTDA